MLPLMLAPVRAREEVGKREGVALPDTVAEAVEEGEREGEPVLLPVEVLEPVGELLCELLRVLLELTVLVPEAVLQGVALTDWLPLRERLGLLVREGERVEEVDTLLVLRRTNATNATSRWSEPRARDLVAHLQYDVE